MKDISDAEFLRLVTRLTYGELGGFGTRWRSRYWWGDRHLDGTVSIRFELPPRFAVASCEAIERSSHA